MLTFFERSPLDQVLRNDKVHRIQPCFQSPIKISGAYLVVSCNMTSPMSRWLHSWSNIALCTFFFFCRNHAVQWILSGQHRNHCIWSQSPRRKRETLIHWLCGTYVSINTTPHYFSPINLVPITKKNNPHHERPACFLPIFQCLLLSAHRVFWSQDPPPPQEVCLCTSSFPGCV